MCEGARLLGENYEAIEAGLFEARCAVWRDELEQLAQAKLGLRVAVRLDAEGHSVLELGDGRALGVMPWWCRRSVDRADPLRLMLRFSMKPRETDELQDFKVSIFERPTA